MHKGPRGGRGLLGILQRRRVCRLPRSSRGTTADTAGFRQRLGGRTTAVWQCRNSKGHSAALHPSKPTAAPRRCRFSCQPRFGRVRDVAVGQFLERLPPSRRSAMRDSECAFWNRLGSLTSRKQDGKVVRAVGLRSHGEHTMVCGPMHNGVYGGGKIRCGTESTTVTKQVRAGAQIFIQWKWSLRPHIAIRDNRREGQRIFEYVDGHLRGIDSPPKT